MKNYQACKELWSFFNKKKIRKISHHISAENQKLIPQYSILSGADITQENSVDPDEMQHNAASHLGLHCNAASQLIWVCTVCLRGEDIHTVLILSNALLCT